MNWCTYYKNCYDEKQEELIENQEKKLFDLEATEWLIDFGQYNNMEKRNHFQF